MNYRSWGFVTSADYGITAHESVGLPAPECLMVKELIPDGLNGIYGKVEYIAQEIFARLAMYNFCELITSHVVIQNKRRKYVYQTNFTAAVHICRHSSEAL